MDLKKFIGMIFITALIIAFLVWIASIIFSFSYSEWGFFIGIGLTIVICFLTVAEEQLWVIMKQAYQCGKFKRMKTLK